MPNDLNLKISANAKEANSQLDKLTNNAKRLSSAGSKLNNGLKHSNKNFNGMHKQLRNINVDANRVTNSVGKMTSGFSRFNNMLKTVNVALLAHASATAIQSSLEMVETTNLYSVSLGEVAVEANKVMKQMSEITGLDLTTLQNAQGTFALLARSMGVSTEKAQQLSENAVKLAVDLSSLMNVPFSQAMADLKSGFVGQTETVYKYGLDLTEASLEQEAFRLGIEKSVRSMSQGEKMILRYTASIRNTTLAQGDFAKTIETPANQLRILGERITTLGRSIGTVFIGAITNVLPYINAFVSVLTILINLLASFFGYTPDKVKNTTNGFSDMSDSIDEAGDNTAKLAKELKNITAPFDELNVISEPSGSGADKTELGISQEMLDAITGYDNMLSSVRQKSTDIRDRMLEWLGIQRKLNEETGDYEITFIQDGFADKIKKAIASDDFNAVGVALAEKLNEVTSMANEAVKWENIRENVKGELLNITELINGFFGEYDWNLLGETIANGINSAVESAIILLFNIDWALIGTSIGEQINTSISKINWNRIGDLIGIGLNSAVTTAFNFLSNVDFGLLAESIMNTINNAIERVDWYNVGATLATGLNGAMKFFNTLIANFDLFGTIKAIFDFLKGVIENIDWLELAEFLINIFDIVTLKSFLNGVLKKLPDLGKTIIKNAKEGFSIRFTELRETVAELLGELFDKTIDPMFKKQKWLDILADVKTAFKETFASAINGVINIVETGLNYIIRKANTVSWSIPEWVPVVGGKTFGFNLPELEIPRIKLARGGMLDGGQSFIAGEMGKAELIGSYQNKTTVMPLENSGFIEAMYNAVYNAVTSAQDSGGSVIENVLQLDGQVIYKNQQKIAKSKGVNFGMAEFAR